MDATRTRCLEDPRELWERRVCLEEVSKDLRGGLERLDAEKQPCGRRCDTLKSDHLLALEVTAHECDRVPSLDGRLIVRRLIHAFADADGRRGLHSGRFEWIGDGVRLEGTMHGITHAGTHREPAFEGCQRCHQPGDLEGRLCGRIRRAVDRDLVGREVVAAYRLRLRSDLLRERRVDAAGTLEGLLVERCTTQRCAEVATQTVGSYPNPWSFGGHEWYVVERDGSPAAMAEVTTWGGVTGLDVRSRARVTLQAPASSVEVTLARFSAGAVVTALDGSGSLVATEVLGGAATGTPETAVVAGADIATVLIGAPAHEVLVQRLCVD